MLTGMLVVHPRSSWTAQGWAGRVHRVPDQARTEYMIHYEGGSPTHDTGAAAMRAIDSIHRGHGWCGIGYNFVVMLDGTVWEGRGWPLVGAHCTGHNRSGWGVQVHIGGHQQPTEAALRAVVDLHHEATLRAGHTLRVLGHRDAYPTECPEDLLEEWLRAGMPLTGAPPAPDVPAHKPTPGIPGPRFPLPTGWYFGPRTGPEWSVSGYYSHRADLARWQRRMRDRHWDIAADGLYGPQTAGVARGFQREKRLAVDGLVGVQTWTAAWELPIT